MMISRNTNAPVDKKMPAFTAQPIIEIVADTGKYVKPKALNTIKKLIGEIGKDSDTVKLTVNGIEKNSSCSLFDAYSHESIVESVIDGVATREQFFNTKIEGAPDNTIPCVIAYLKNLKKAINPQIRSSIENDINKAKGRLNTSNNRLNKVQAAIAELTAKQQKIEESRRRTINEINSNKDILALYIPR